MREFSEFAAWFVRHSYWMFNLGVIVGAGLSIGAWLLVHKMQEWRERHNYEVWERYRKPVQSARSASAGRMSA